MNLPHDSFAGTVVAGLVLTGALFVVVRLLTSAG
jgi:hypothetical protein